MSYILDALKKSEAERQKKDAPGIADLPGAAPRRAAPRWLFGVAALLAVNLAVLLGLLLDGEEGGASAPPAATAANGDTDGASFRDIVAAARERQQTRETAPQPAPASRQTPPAPPARSAPATSSGTAQLSAKPAAATEPLASFQELRAGGRLQLPDLHLDIHVYSETPAERFVFINMNKYREQSTLAEGPRVREITTDGVILELEGTAFLLPRD